MKKKVFILAGEHSGDFYGAALAKDLKAIDDNLLIMGIGSKRMKDAGVKLLYDSSLWSAIGYVDALSKIPGLILVFGKVKKYLLKEKFDLLVLIDFPGFNMRLARLAKKIGLKTVYYFPPSAWTEKTYRAISVSSTVDKVIVTFSHTKNIYNKAGYDPVFFGHPMPGLLRPELSEEEAGKLFNLSRERPVISIFPGSRPQEIKDILPVLLQTAKIIRKKLPEVQFAVSSVSYYMKNRIEKSLLKENFEAPVITGNPYSLMNLSSFIIATSGTVTLEAACFKVPMVIVYKVSRLSWYIAKNTLDLPDYAGLPNLVMEREIIPEFVHYNISPSVIAEKVLDILLNPPEAEKMKEDLQEVLKRLGPPDAGEKISREIYSMIG